MGGKEYSFFIYVNNGKVPWEFQTKQEAIQKIKDALIYTQRYDAKKFKLENTETK